MSESNNNNEPQQEAVASSGDEGYFTGNTFESEDDASTSSDSSFNELDGCEAVQYFQDFFCSQPNYRFRSYRVGSNSGDDRDYVDEYFEEFFCGHGDHGSRSYCEGSAPTGWSEWSRMSKDFEMSLNERFQHTLNWKIPFWGMAALGHRNDHMAIRDRAGPGRHEGYLHLFPSNKTESSQNLLMWTPHLCRNLGDRRDWDLCCTEVYATPELDTLTVALDLGWEDLGAEAIGSALARVSSLFPTVKYLRIRNFPAATLQSGAGRQSICKFVRKAPRSLQHLHLIGDLSPASPPTVTDQDGFLAMAVEIQESVNKKKEGRCLSFKCQPYPNFFGFFLCDEEVSMVFHPIHGTQATLRLINKMKASMNSIKFVGINEPPAEFYKLISAFIKALSPSNRIHLSVSQHLVGNSIGRIDYLRILEILKAANTVNSIYIGLSEANSRTKSAFIDMIQENLTLKDIIGLGQVDDQEFQFKLEYYQRLNIMGREIASRSNDINKLIAILEECADHGDDYLYFEMLMSSAFFRSFCEEIAKLSTRKRKRG